MPKKTDKLLAIMQDKKFGYPKALGGVVKYHKKGR
jgi:hypothetical protein